MSSPHAQGTWEPSPSTSAGASFTHLTPLHPPHPIPGPASLLPKAKPQRPRPLRMTPSRPLKCIPWLRPWCLPRGWDSGGEHRMGPARGLPGVEAVAIPWPSHSQPRSHQCGLHPRPAVLAHLILTNPVYGPQVAEGRL